jgi:hypothetical protein
LRDDYLRIAVAEEWEQFRNPEEGKISPTGSCYQRTAKDKVY